MGIIALGIIALGIITSAWGHAPGAIHHAINVLT
jgi:hypothetical protein